MPKFVIVPLVVVLALNTLTPALPLPLLPPFLLFVGLVKDLDRMETGLLLFGNWGIM